MFVDQVSPLQLKLTLCDWRNSELEHFFSVTAAKIKKKWVMVLGTFWNIVNSVKVSNLKKHCLRCNGFVLLLQNFKYFPTTHNFFCNLTVVLLKHLIKNDVIHVEILKTFYVFVWKLVVTRLWHFTTFFSSGNNVC